MVTRLIVVCVLIVGTQLTVVVLHGGMDPQPSPLPSIGTTTLPVTIGDFTSREEPIDKRVVAATSAEAMINRVYNNQLGDSVIVNVGVWTKYKRGIPHSPEACYPSAGWEIVSRRAVTIPVTGDKPMSIKQFVFQRETSRIAVAFWVHCGNECITDNDSIRQLLQRLRTTGGPLPPLVKVMLHTDAQDLDQAEARLARFVAAIAESTRSIK